MVLRDTVHDRIEELRKDRNLSQKQLAEMIGIAPSQLSRIESGETKHVSSDILIALAKAFGVSTDYILGLTNISVPKSYDISQLGLSEGAVRALVTDTVDVQVVNRLMEHKSFPYLIHMIKSYLSGGASAAIMARNDIINMVTSTLGDFLKDHPEHRAEGRDDLRTLRSEKLGDHEAEKEKIRSTFMSMLNDMKKATVDGDAPGESVTSELTRQMLEQAQAARQDGKSVTKEDMAVIMLNVVKQTAPIDEQGGELFKQLAMQMLTGTQKQDADH